MTLESKGTGATIRPMRRFFKGGLLLLLCPSLIAGQESSAVDRAFDLFWNAGSVKGAEKAAEAILSSGASFPVVHARLAQVPQLEGCECCL